MKLVTYFDSDEIKEIYNYVLAYSIRYFENNDILKDFKPRYDYAKNIEKININLPIEQIKEYLDKKIEKFKQNIDDNRSTIDAYAPAIEGLFVNYFNYYTSGYTVDDLAKLNYVFDFITNYITHSETQYEYTKRIPPVDYQMIFDFKDDVPVNHNINDVLIQGQGMSNEIANLFVHLSKLLGVEVEKIFTIHNNSPYALIMAKINNKPSLIDPTKMIRGEMDKDECFLVSKEKLTKLYYYDFKQFNESIGETYTINNAYKTKYDINEIIHQIKVSLPKIKKREYEIDKKSIL